MGKRSAVDGCKSPCASEHKRMKLLEMRGISLFSAPRSPSQLEKWNDAFSGNTEKLSSPDSVCAKHFHHEDIETHYFTELADGSMHMHERGRPSLRANAIPLRLPNNAECSVKVEKDPGTATLSTRMVSTKKVFPNIFEFVPVKNEANEGSLHGLDDTDTNTDGYSIHSLARDLEETNWREGWVWSGGGNSSCIKFLQFDTAKMEPRIYCCISNTMKITIFVGGKSSGNGVHSGTLGSFAEITTLLGMIETLKPCAGTGCKAEIRAAACSGFIGDVYSKKSTSVQCFSCRVVRHKL